MNPTRRVEPLPPRTDADSELVDPDWTSPEHLAALRVVERHLFIAGNEASQGLAILRSIDDLIWTRELAELTDSLVELLGRIAASTRKEPRGGNTVLSNPEP